MLDVPVPCEEINERLRKVEGQVRGIQKMVDNERDCVDILTQLTAVKSGLQSVAALVLRNYVSICMSREAEKDIGEDLAHAVSVWIGGRG